MNKLLDKANDKNFYSGWNIVNKLGLDYFENRRFRVQEHVYRQENITKRKIKSLADEIMADQSLLEEIDRIYSRQNEKKYHPKLRPLRQLKYIKPIINGLVMG